MLPRLGAAPIPSIKPPERCPHCNSKRLIKKGTRRKKLENVPLYRCRACGRTFASGPRGLRNKTYPIPEILDALTTYNRGATLQEVAATISSRYGHPVAPSTVLRWLAEHPRLTTYRRLRERGRHLFKPGPIIRTIKLYHRQVYDFAYHRAKLVFLRDGVLDDKRAASADSTARFAALADFVESIPATCPHDLFLREDGARGSQLDAAFIDPARLMVMEKQNTATEMAKLVLPAVGSNYERHPKLQRFMLANDSVTVAVEVPIWLAASEIASLEKEHGITLLPESSSAKEGGGAITGHIDFLQLRNGAVHILDYKPDAHTNKPIAQLTVYALALTRLVPGLKLFDIKCAWFNENEYCEFFPRALLSRGRKKAA
jgi:hypothetical protein